MGLQESWTNLATKQQYCTVFYCGCTKCSSVLFSPHFHQHFFLVFLMNSISASVEWYSIVLFPNNWWYWASFHVNVRNCLRNFVYEKIFWSSAHFLSRFFYRYVCMCSLFWISIPCLSDIFFSNIFSHSVGCFFILFLVSLAVQKLFQWI